MEYGIAEDGSCHAIEGNNPSAIMAGLHCGTLCRVIWPAIQDKELRTVFHVQNNSVSLLINTEGAQTLMIVAELCEEVKVQCTSNRK